ncbi:MAG: hypothetical protein ACE14V_08835 [bacterium]
MKCVNRLVRLGIAFSLVIYFVSLFGCFSTVFKRDTTTLNHTKICKDNLRILDRAKQQWALDNKKPADAAPTINELWDQHYISAIPVCPSGGIYTLNVVSKYPTCSIPGHTIAYNGLK